MHHFLQIFFISAVFKPWPVCNKYLIYKHNGEESPQYLSSFLKSICVYWRLYACNILTAGTLFRSMTLGCVLSYKELVVYFVDRAYRYKFLPITSLTHFFMYLLISCLYMFRASQCSSSGDRIVLIHLVWLVCVSDCLVCRSGGNCSSLLTDIPSSHLFHCQILANNQLDPLFYVFIYFFSLHVSSVTVLIIRRSNCINTSSGMISLCKWLLGMPVRTGLPSIHRLIIPDDVPSPWPYTTHSGCVFYSPLSGFSLLAYEVTWSHTSTRHSR